MLRSAEACLPEQLAWPREAQIHRENPKAGTPHTDTDIRLQKVLACALPPLALALLSWTFYRSRGAYRLSGAVLSVPGHPDVPLDAIRAIDKSKWDRKGIAYVDYDVAQEPGQLVLDDFIYDRPPTDRIVERIEAHLSRVDAPTSADRSSM